MRTRLLTAAACLLASLTQLQAGTLIQEPDGKDGKKNVVPDEFPYTQGTKEFQFGGGGFLSFDTADGHNSTRPDMGYGLGIARLGVMLYTPHGDHWYRGNVEAFLEGFGGKIWSGPGDVLGGSEILLRYNFVQPQAKIVPFFQIGGGGVWSDAAYANEVQHLIGSRWSFNLEGEVGWRYMFTRNAAVELGFEYRHISNADTASRNRGLNVLGGDLMFCYFF
jgi:opacity protein-like surface antigen